MKLIVVVRFCGSTIPSQRVALGHWHFGETYAHDIIRDLTHWSIGWVDWNMVLDTNGGPNWAKKMHQLQSLLIQKQMNIIKIECFMHLDIFENFDLQVLKELVLILRFSTMKKEICNVDSLKDLMEEML